MRCDEQERAEHDHALYPDLRRLAASLMRGERSDHTLQPTALVHEAWLRLERSQAGAGLDRGELLGLAARVMRQVLTDHARRRSARRRGGRRARSPWTDIGHLEAPADWLLDVDAALTELERTDVELARLVMLRFYAGLTTDEAADAMGLSRRTFLRRWRFAKAWLQSRLREDHR
ncbi:MAG: ECF-type sigma factor [Planctomycetota bacterium]